MEQKQTFKGDQFSGSGHTYVKQKFSSKDEFDKVNKKTGGTASFKNPFSKFVLPAVSNVQRMPTSLNAYVPPGLSEAEYKALKKAEDAKKAQNKQRFPKGKKTLDIADWLKTMEQKQTFKGDQFSGSGHTYVKQKFSSKDEFDKVNKKTGGTASFKNPFSKFVLPAVSNVKHGNVVGTQDSMAFASGKDFEEEKAVQKVVANDSNMPISVSAIGIGFVSFATMLGLVSSALGWFHMRRGLQSATVLGSDLSVAMAPALGDNFLELETQGSAGQNSRSVGWGHMSSQNSSPLTPCYAFGSFGQKKAEPSTPARRPTSSGMSEMPSAALPW